MQDNTGLVNKENKQSIETIQMPTAELTGSSTETVMEVKGSEIELSAEVQQSVSSTETRSRKRFFGPYSVFFVVLGLLAVIAWSIPLRPTVSESERRKLEEFPVYETKALFSGEYFRSIENWFSDTFTFREDWISLSDSIKRLFGIHTVAIYGEMPVVDEIPVTDPKTEALSEIETVENETTVEEITDVADIEENNVEDEQEDWGGIVIEDEELIADRGAKLQIGDAMFVFPGFSKGYAEKYAQRMNKTAELLKGKANFYCIIAPHAVTSMLTREDREKYGFVIEEDAFDFMYGLMSDDVGKVNVIENLQKHNSEYITFRSDPHWTALGAYYAYEVWCEVAGKAPVPLSEYKEYAWTGFLGAYYNTGGQPKALRDNPDTVYAYEPPGDVHLYLDFNHSLKKKGSEVSLLADRSRKKTGDHYITFLSTDQAKATFINNDIDDDSAVLVMKTSFGNPFVYYLTQHYHYVYVIDIRYYNYSLSKFIAAQKVDDVILIHNTDLCYSENAYKTVSRLLK